MAAGWASNTRKLNSTAKDIENDFFMGALLSQKSSGVELMQNCDLPPPSKVFSGADQTSMDRGFRLTGREEETRTDFDVESEKLELLKALRLSQTRAREAERRAANLVKEKEMISNGLLGESMQLLAHRQWARFLEIQESKMQKQQEKNCDGEDMDGISWFAALAMGLGIAFGCRYLF